jgi:hypothetical protein
VIPEQVALPVTQLVTFHQLVSWILVGGPTSSFFLLMEVVVEVDPSISLGLLDFVDVVGENTLLS